ncbi:unnamed protein product [Phytophthora fragariaefolia]|uniref:Unnamed protein product n=1 Tax=Phytophthora fragariaefolia TaxID=1490495 RepID=A0A9W6Y9K6_9STRA|nr:unnamed protein product [Phytophthora fragariaefolia]
MLHGMLNVMLHGAEYDAAWTVDDGEDEAGETLGAELIADTEDGLNAVEDGDIAADYGAIKSGGDADKDDVESNEDDDDIRRARGHGDDKAPCVVPVCRSADSTTNSAQPREAGKPLESH